jgi:hypothetical protein
VNVAMCVAKMFSPQYEKMLILKRNRIMIREVLVRICLALHGDIGDIAEMVLPDSLEV